jgi:hypothetical protein
MELGNICTKTSKDLTQQQQQQDSKPLNYGATDNYLSTSELNNLDLLITDHAIGNDLINPIANTSTSQGYLASHKFEDDEDYSLLPNDIVEFNSMDELIDYFNNSSSQDKLLANIENNFNTADQQTIKFDSNTDQFNVFRSQMTSAAQHQNKFVGSDFGWLLTNSIRNLNTGGASVLGGSAPNNQNNMTACNNDNSINSEEKYLQTLNLVTNFGNNEMRANVSTGQNKGDSDQNKLVFEWFQ